MADIVSKDVRSRMMSGIRSKNTKPELVIRKGLHAAGFRYRLHDKVLQGKPDLVLPKYHAVIFAHGCFWHGHDCHLFRLPATRTSFWQEKIKKNVKRDNDVLTVLKDSDWRIAVVWECALKGKTRLGADMIIGQLADWLRSDKSFLEIRGEKK